MTSRITRAFTGMALSASLMFAQGPAPKAAVAIAPAVPNSYKDLKYPPIHNIKVPDVTRYELANGMKVLLVEDHELPTVAFSARIRVGNRWEPEGKTGLTSILGSVMRTGGSTTRKGDDLDKQLDAIGASVESSIAENFGSVGGGGLKEHTNLLLGIMSEILRNPALPQDKIDLAKTELRDGISRRNDDASDILSRVAAQIAYGKGSPYADQPEYDTVDGITRDDLVAFHQRFYQPQNVILAVWGDFSASDMKAKIDQAFGSWPKGNNPIPQPPPVGADAGKARGLYLVDKTDVNQTKIVFTRLSGQANDPDYFALQVMNQILGGGFTSRLFNEVRTKGGLAYDPYSSWSAGFDHPGTFVAGAGTKTETTSAAYKTAREVLVSMSSKPVSDAELQRAKDSLLKGFAFDFDSSAKIVNRLATYEYYGYPSDFLQRYRDSIAKVTIADITRVSKKYLNVDDMAVLMVGNVKAFDVAPETLGLPVTKVDITIPKASSAQVSEATPETLEKGKALLAKARNALGGDKLDAIKDFKRTETIKANTPQGALELQSESTITLDGRQLQSMNVMGQNIVQGSDGKTMWAKTPAGVQERPLTDDVKKTAASQTYFLLAKPAFDRLKAQSLGEVDFRGSKGEAVQVTDPATGAETKFIIEATSGKILGLQAEMSILGPKSMVDVLLADYKDFGGIQVATKTTIFKGPQTLAETLLSAFAVNTGVTDATFAKPAQ